jgi:hypothetical protein
MIILLREKNIKVGKKETLRKKDNNVHHFKNPSNRVIINNF